jgi:adenine-specific DNA-methyltransferase
VPLRTDPYIDLWQGDSAELCKRFNPAKQPIQCVITDPPFGVDSQMNSATTVTGRDHARKIENDADPVEAMIIFKAVMSVLLTKMADHSDVYVFTSQAVLKDWLVSLDDFMPQFGFSRPPMTGGNGGVLIWEKGYPGKGDLESWGIGYEFILQYRRGRRPRTDAKRLNGVLHCDNLPPASLIHPHEKPTPLLEMLIKHSTNRGDWLVDPFAGSFSLGRAAEATGRPCIGMELDERNHKAACAKMEQGGFDF